jgi:uncharacterized membrane protein
MRKIGKAALPVLVGVALLVVGAPSSVWAGPSVPEIDPSSGMSALALIAGAVALMRGRSKN